MNALTAETVELLQQLIRNQCVIMGSTPAGAEPPTCSRAIALR